LPGQSSPPTFYNLDSCRMRHTASHPAFRRNPPMI
jgi:hypothetical protein